MQTLQFISRIQYSSENEYLRRAKVQEQFVEDFNRKTGANVKYIEAPYEPHKFMKMVKDKELADEKKAAYVVLLVLKCA